MGSLVRVQLSPPLGSPCRSRASTFLPLGITAEGCTFFRVHLGDVNSSGHHSVHTVVWLSCRKIGVARLVESLRRRASPMRCSGDALNLKLPCFMVIVLLSYTPTSHCRKDHPQPRIPHLQTRILLFPVLLPMLHFHGRPVHN